MKPQMPAYGPPPAVLHPLNPRHYGLLLFWLFFQPSQLKYYLYTTDPELYLGRSWAVFNVLRLPAYRNLLLMTLLIPFLLPTVFVLLTLLFGILIVVVVILLRGGTIYWSNIPNLFLNGVRFGVSLGLFGILFGGFAGFFVGGVLSAGIVPSIINSVIGGLVGGVMGSIITGLLAGLEFSILSFTPFNSVISDVWFELVLVIAIGVVSSVVSTTIGSLVRGIASGVLTGVLAGIMVGGLLGMAGGSRIDLIGPAKGCVLGGIVGFLSGSRLSFYPFTTLMWQVFRRGKDLQRKLRYNPVCWDTLSPWRQPEADALLSHNLRNEWTVGLQMAANIAANPFQRGRVQRALVTSLQNHSQVLNRIYFLVRSPQPNTYPTLQFFFEKFNEGPVIAVILLGEVSGGDHAFIDSSGGEHKTSEWLAWWLTRRQRRPLPFKLAGFSWLLYELLRDEAKLAEMPISEIRLHEKAAAFRGVRAYKGGPEIGDSFAALAALLACETPADQAAFYTSQGWLDRLPTPYLRPPVIEALRAFHDVSGEIAFSLAATSRPQQAAALNRAAGALQELRGYIDTEVLPPEQVLCKRAAEHWAALVAKEQGQLGEIALRDLSPAQRRAGASDVVRTAVFWQRPSQPFDNPYIAGDPVYPPLFIGRADVFNRIDAIWGAKENPDSIILYGHRRMGKSSIMRNLHLVAPANSLIVYADLAGETSFVDGTADFLLTLADKIHNALRRARPAVAPSPPDPAHYATPSQALIHFNRLTEQVRDGLGQGTIILALDEFEALEEAVANGRIGPEIYRFLRTKSQEPWLTLVFGGLHTLDEMSRDYQQPFYGSYANIPVSYLPHEAAWQLITNPTEEFALNYEPTAVAQIIALTGGQPYLVQQVCRDALDQLNHELFDLRRERIVQITLADVNGVVDDHAFFQRGIVYFDGVWQQATDPEQRLLLRLMAAQAAPWSLAALARAANCPVETLASFLQWAKRHDILQPITPPASEAAAPQWAFCVPLMRQWIVAHSPREG